jgi:hypothetical protein
LDVSSEIPDFNEHGTIEIAAEKKAVEGESNNNNS